MGGGTRDAGVAEASRAAPAFEPHILVGLLWQQGVSVPTSCGPTGLQQLSAQLRELAARRGDAGADAQRHLVVDLAGRMLAEKPARKPPMLGPYGRFERELARDLRAARAAPGSAGGEQDKVRLTLALPAEQHRAWEAAAARRGVELRVLIRELMDGAVGRA